MRRIIFAATVSIALAACERPPAFEPADAPLPGLLEDVRALQQPDNDARRDALVELLARHGFEPQLHEFPNDGRAGGDARPVGRNVVVSVGAADGGALVVGAHFDAVPVGAGMVDNAASVVVLLHAAQTLRAFPLERRIDFVFFDMEEIGLVGSRHYAESLDPDGVAAMVNLDVNAYGDTVFFGHTAHAHAPLYDALTTVCARFRRTCIDFERYPPTDNLSFERVGIPNVSLSVAPRREVHQLWLLMNGGDDAGLADGFLPRVLRIIHTPADTIDHVEPAAMTLAHDILTGLLLELQ